MSRFLAAAAALLALLLGTAPAAAHGAPTSPSSRSAACGAPGAVTGSPACAAALDVSPELAEHWDNVRVAEVNGRDREMIPDGKLCSAGMPDFRGLDLARVDWPATPLAAGAVQSFGYVGTIPHRGTFRLYVTEPGYTPDQPLSLVGPGGPSRS